MTLNEGWGFCPTDAVVGGLEFRIVHGAQRRVGLLPHRRFDILASGIKPFARSTKGGASAPPTRSAKTAAAHAREPLNEGWGFCPTDAGVEWGIIRLFD